jgi:hypothetical protein
MRNYWLKIILGAFGIFAVGMSIITVVRSVRTKVTTTIRSSDPIPIPLIGLVPFRVDHDKLGSVSRVEFLRSDPEHVAGVRVVVSLPDSTAIERLRRCEIALDDAENIDENSTFRCAEPGTAGAGLEPFGVIAVKGRADSFALLLPQKAVTELRQTTIRLDKSGLHVGRPGGPAEAAARIDSMRESLSDRIQALSDSVEMLKDLASGLEDSATGLGAAPRRRVQRGADSVRTVMRALVDQMKRDEARLKALQAVPGLSREEIDSLARLGSRISDSVRRAVARDLRAAGVDVHKQPATAAVEAGPPAPPAPPKPR